MVHDSFVHIISSSTITIIIFLSCPNKLSLSQPAAFHFLLSLSPIPERDGRGRGNGAVTAEPAVHA